MELDQTNMLRIVDKRDQRNSLIIDHSDGSVQLQQKRALAISARPRVAVQEVPNYDIRTIVRRPSLVKLDEPLDEPGFAVSARRIPYSTRNQIRTQRAATGR